MDAQLQKYLLDRNETYPTKPELVDPDTTTVHTEGDKTVKGYVYAPYIADADLATTTADWGFTVLLVLGAVGIVVAVYGFAWFILGDIVMSIIGH